MKKLILPIIYSQRDPRWALTILGFNTQPLYSIGQFGCKLTCLSMYAAACGKNVTPGQLNDLYRQVTGFASGSGEINDDNAFHKVYGDINLLWTSQRYDSLVPSEVFTKMHELIDSGHALLAEIDFNPATISEEMHFVLIYGYGDNGEYFIADPWTGTRTVLSVYGDPAKEIYRVFCYDRALPVEEPLVEVASSTFTKLVHNSTQWDAACDYFKEAHDSDFTAVLPHITALEAAANKPPVIQTVTQPVVKEVITPDPAADRVEGDVSYIRGVVEWFKSIFTSSVHTK